MYDKTDSKTKCVKNINSVVALSEKYHFVVFTYLGFQSVMLCPISCMNHAKRKYHVSRITLLTIALVVLYNN